MIGNGVLLLVLCVCDCYGITALRGNDYSCHSFICVFIHSFILNQTTRIHKRRVQPTHRPYICTNRIAEKRKLQKTKQKRGEKKKNRQGSVRIERQMFLNIKFARWQHRAMRRWARFAAPVVEFSLRWCRAVLQAWRWFSGRARCGCPTCPDSSTPSWSTSPTTCETFEKWLSSTVPAPTEHFPLFLSVCLSDCPVWPPDLKRAAAPTLWRTVPSLPSSCCLWRRVVVGGITAYMWNCWRYFLF